MKKQEKRKSVYETFLTEFIKDTDILVICPKCSKKAFVKVDKFWKDIRFICLNCGHNKIYKESNGTIAQGIDPFLSFATLFKRKYK